MDAALSHRQEAAGCRRLVVKVGTRLMTDTALAAALVAQIDRWRRRGADVLLVSSGAVGLGLTALNMSVRPKKLPAIQALAALGQSKLMSLYDKECAARGFHAGQLLLTTDDLENRRRHLNALNCIRAMWENNILPVVNENDSVSVDELKFGDNDTLASLVAAMTRAELTVLLTTVDGLRSRRSDGALGERVPLVDDINDEVKSLASGSDDSAMSVGGMRSKLRAAEIVHAVGGYLLIADGRDPGVLDRVFAAEDVGTLFTPRLGRRMPSYKRWLSLFARVSGRLMVDVGAVDALRRRGGSLLSSGLVGVGGEFARDDIVEIVDENRVIVARGVVNRDSAECAVAAGKSGAVLVHRNNMVLI